MWSDEAPCFCPMVSRDSKPTGNCHIKIVIRPPCFYSRKGKPTGNLGPSFPLGHFLGLTGHWPTQVFHNLWLFLRERSMTFCMEKPFVDPSLQVTDSLQNQQGKIKHGCSVTLEKSEPFLGKTIFSGATHKKGQQVPLN